MIKPCPLCNTEVNVICLGGNFKVKCNNCETSSGLYNTAQQAIDAWNKRPREEELLNALRDIIYSGVNPETVPNKIDNGVFLLGKYGDEK